MTRLPDFDAKSEIPLDLETQALLREAIDRELAVQARAVVDALAARFTAWRREGNER